MAVRSSKKSPVSWKKHSGNGSKKKGCIVFKKFHHCECKLNVLFAVVSILFINMLTGSEFFNPHDHYNGKKIARLKVCGERCSGTNFLYHLLHKNFPDLAPTHLLEYGQKHFLWWFNTSLDEEKLKKLKYAHTAVDFSDAQDCLFVIVIREPYDWLRSFYLVPWCAHRSITRKGFFHFISSEWRVTDNYPQPEDGQYNEIDNYNPWTGKPFTNVLELRKYKIINYLSLSKIVDNYLVVRYEEVRDNPKGFINFVAGFYNLTKVKEFIPIDTEKGSDLPYIRKKYFPITQTELDFINAQIDWKTERLMGFSRKNKVQ